MKTLVKARKIYTLNTPNETYNSMIIEEGKIISIGNDLVLDSNGIVHDYDQHTILPSFNDSHMHLLGYAQSLGQCSLEGCCSIDEMKERIQFFASTSSQPWIVGRGWNQDHFSDLRMPQKEDLDALPIDKPMIFYRACGHIALLNSKALEISGIHASLKLSGGSVDSVCGHPTGIIRESALDLVSPHLPKQSLKEWSTNIDKAISHLNAYGITSVQSDDLPLVELDSLKALFGEPYARNIKLYEQSQFTSVDALTSALSQGYVQNENIGALRLGPLKILADGSLGARTARMQKPYADAPDERGLMIYSVDVIEHFIELSLKNHMDVAIHGIGDETIQVAIDAFKKYQTPEKQHRNSIVHCQIMSDKQIKEMAEQGIHALVQPVFLEYDMSIVRNRVGDALARTSYAYRTMLDRGIRLGFGSDCPVEDPNPFRSLYYAVSRKRPSGESFVPEEAITLYEAWRAFTVDAAYFSYEELSKGLLMPGYDADFIVLMKDPFDMAYSELLETKVEATYLNGKCVYSR